MRRQSICGAIVSAMLATSVIVPAAAAPGGQGNGNGNAYGFGYGGGGATASGLSTGGAAPLPLIGMTFIGQAVGAGGLILLWRRRKKSA